MKRTPERPVSALRASRALATRRGYIVALLLIATLTATDFLIVAHATADVPLESRIVTTAGRLSTNVERIVELSRELAGTTSAADRADLRRLVVATARRIDTDLATLRDPARNPGGWPAPVVRALLDDAPYEIRTRLTTFTQHARRLANASGLSRYSGDLYYDLDMHDSLVVALNSLVDAYVDDMRRREARVLASEAIGLAVILITLLLEIAFIFRPMERTIAKREALLLEHMAANEKTITELRRSEAALERAQRAARVGSVQRDLRSGAVAISDELFRIAGLDPALVGTANEDMLWRFVHPDDLAAVRTAAAAALASGETFRIDCRLLLDDGTIRWINHTGFYERDELGTPAFYYGTSVDITDRKRAEERLFHAASHDSLTGLGNRDLLVNALEGAVAVAERTGTQPAILFIDLDHFKPINDTLGHVAGDRVLMEVAARLQHASSSASAIARAGGDEFVVVIADRRSVGDLGRLAAKIVTALSLPHRFAGRELICTASIGISCFGDDGDDGQTLLRHADAAMYAAKAAGGNDFRFYSASMHAQSNERLWLEADLRSGIEREEFELFYQPIVSAATGEMSGVEALLRWNHPTLGLVGPDRFMAIAEANGSIVPLGEWVLRTACVQARRWRDERWPHITMSVNLSARQLRNERLAHAVATILHESGLPAAALELELTESAVISDIDAAVATMTDLRALGVRIAVDDFGTGYASMAYLKRLPVDTVKVDRMFVRDLPEDRGDIAIVRAVTLMAHELGLDVTAEGVEEQRQADFLTSLGCDSLQGYLFCRPLAAAALEATCGSGQAGVGYAGTSLARDTLAMLN